MSQWLLSAPTARQIHVSRGRKDAVPGVHLLSEICHPLGLLQLTVLRHLGSLSRMRLHVWCRALDVKTASRQCYRSCTGFRFDVGWISRWPSWSTCHCPAWLQPIWSPTASWSPTKVIVTCVLPHKERVL